MKKGFTLVEMMVVLLIFSFLFIVMFTVLTSSNRSWAVGQGKLSEQQEARKSLDRIANSLRQASGAWTIDGTPYSLTVSESNQRIDFYNPVFDSNGAITALKKVTFKLDPDNAKQLLSKEGTDEAAIVSNQITGISFGAGCSGCTTFTCTTPANDCPMVEITLSTYKQSGFTLASRIALRNQATILPGEVSVQEPSEGSF